MNAYLPQALTDDIRYLLRESLTNTARYAQASQVQATIAIEAGRVNIKVSDDGLGFPFQKQHDLAGLTAMHLGPKTLMERIATLNGQLIINSSAAGASLEMTVPQLPQSQTNHFTRADNAFEQEQKPMTISLVLVDDHPLVLNGLQQLFAMQPYMNVMACCTDGEQALQAVMHYQPDILILDLKMPRKNGLAVLRKLQKEKLPTKVVLLTAALDDDEVLEAIRLGVRGVVLKEMAPQLLIQCINKVHAGGEWMEKDSVGRALEKMLKRETGIQHITQILTPPRDQARQADSRWLQQQTNCRKAFHYRRHRKGTFA